MNNSIRYLFHEMLDIVLKEDGISWYFGGKRSDVVPDVLEIVDEVVVANRCRVVDDQSYVKFEAFAVLSDRIVVGKDEVVLLVAEELYEVGVFLAEH